MIDLELEVIREYLKDTYTVGILYDTNGLYYPARYICNTLEDKVRDLNDYNHDGDFNDEGEGKIYGQTAIPAGKYEIKIVWWEKHKDYFPMLQDVPGFTGILIHGGATANDSLGCILVGENKAIGRLVNGPYWSTVIRRLIKNHFDNDGGKCFITIKQ